MVSGLWRGLHILIYCGLGDTALRQAEEEIVSGFSVGQGQDGATPAFMARAFLTATIANSSGTLQAATALVPHAQTTSTGDSQLLGLDPFALGVQW